MISLRFLAAAALFALAACSGDTAGAVPVASVQIQAPRAEVPPGVGIQLVATPRGADGKPLDRPVEWSSRHPAIAMVENDGRVMAIEPGAATIVARAGGVAGELVVTVLPYPVGSVRVSPDTATLVPGGSRQLAATVRDENTNVLTGRAVAWTSSNEAVATVDASGRVTAHAEGTAAVRAASEGVQSAPAAVTVLAPVATLSIDPASARLVVAQKQAFTVTARDAAGRVLSGRAVTVSTSAPAVLGLLGDTLHALAPGTATLTAQAEGRTATAQVTVVPPVGGVVVTPDTATLAPGTTRQLAAVVNDAAGVALPGRAVSWLSSNTAVATVDGDGRITAHAEGTAAVRASSEGVQSAPATVIVRIPIASLSLQIPSARMVVGQRQAFAVVARDAAGRELAGRPVAVATSAPGIAGLAGDSVHALAPGTATLTAQAEGRTAAVELTVVPPVASVTLSPDTATLAPGATRTLSVAVRDAEGNALSGRAVTWQTSNEYTARVGADGLLRGVTVGTAYIHAVSEGVRSAPATVVVRFPIASLSLQLASTEMAVGDAQGLVVIARDASGQVLTGRTVAVSSSAPGVLAISADSLHARGAGAATITARAEGHTASAEVTVLPAPTLVGGIISTDTRWTREGSPYRLTATVQVAYGATLTIDPGVTVQGRGHRLQLWGALHAVGTEAQPIRFTSTHVGGRGESGKPFTIRLERLVMDGGSLYAPEGHAEYGSLVLRGSVLRDLSEYLYVWYPVADVVIEGNRFVRSGGISAGADTRARPVRVYVRNNAFVDWTGDFAVQNWASYGGEVMVVERNSFLSPGRTAVRLRQGYDAARMSAPNNYWGTTDEAVIRSVIFDRDDDLTAAGTIEYRPWLTAPDPGTPAP